MTGPDFTNEQVRTRIAVEASRSATYTILQRSMTYLPARSEVRAEYWALGIRRTAVMNVERRYSDASIAGQAAGRLWSSLLAPTVFCGACGYDHHLLQDCGDARRGRQS